MKLGLHRFDHLGIVAALFVCFVTVCGAKPQANPSDSSNQSTNQSSSSPSPNQNSAQGSTGSLSVGPSILSYEAQDRIGRDIAYEISTLNTGYFSLPDLKDVSSLADIFEKPGDDFTKLLCKRLSSQTREALHTCHLNRATEPRAAQFLIRDLNNLINGSSLYSAKLFAPAVDAQVAKLISARGKDITRLNRILLETSFSGLINKCAYFDHPINSVFVTTSYPNANNALLLYRYVGDELDDLTKKLNNDDDNFGGGSGVHGFFPATAQDAVSAITQLIALFTTATTMTSTPVVTNELAVIPGLLLGLREAGFQSQFIDLSLDVQFTSDPSSLFRKLSSAAVLRAQAQVLLNKYSTQITDVNNKLIANPDYNNLQGYQKAALGSLAATTSAYDAFYTNIVLTNINALLAADFYEVRISHSDGSALLVLRSLYAGGDDRIKSNPFVNLFTDGPRFSYVGGGSAAYFLIGQNGQVLLSRTSRNFEGFKKLENADDYVIHNNLSNPDFSR